MNRIVTFILIISVVFAASFSMVAQERKSPLRNFFGEVGVGMGKHLAPYTDGIHRSTTQITTAIGYKFHPRWNAGVGLTFEAGKYREFRPKTSVFASYDFFRYHRLSVFAQLQGSYCYTKEYSPLDGFNPDGINNSNSLDPIIYRHEMWECGVRFGASVNINNHLSVMLRYLFIGYSTRNDYNRFKKGITDNYGNLSGIVGKHNFIMDAGLRPLQLSLRYTF